MVLNNIVPIFGECALCVAHAVKICKRCGARLCVDHLKNVKYSRELGVWIECDHKE